MISRYDRPHTFFYLDPPYLHETRSSTGEYGPHEMSPEQHEDLLELLGTIRGKFILSGYPSKIYDRQRWRRGWGFESKEIDNKASSAKTKEMKTECLWMNF